MTRKLHTLVNKFSKNFKNSHQNLKTFLSQCSNKEEIGMDFFTILFYCCLFFIVVVSVFQFNWFFFPSNWGKTWKIYVLLSVVFLLKLLHLAFSVQLSHFSTFAYIFHGENSWKHIFFIWKLLTFVMNFFFVWNKI